MVLVGCVELMSQPGPAPSKLRVNEAPPVQEILKAGEGVYPSRGGGVHAATD